MCCFVFSATSSGRVRPAASLMYALSAPMIELTFCCELPRTDEVAERPIGDGRAAAAIASPPNSKRPRRVKNRPEIIPLPSSFKTPFIFMIVLGPAADQSRAQLDY